MCEALRELMKEEIEIDKKKSREQGMAHVNWMRQQRKTANLSVSGFSCL